MPSNKARSLHRGKVPVVINVAGYPRLLFTIEQRDKDDDVLIIIKAPQFIDITIPDEAREKRSVTDMHLSVHCSDQSPSQINVLKLTLQTDDNLRREHGHFTPALKQANRCTVVHVCRATDLAHPQFIYSGKYGPPITLGSFDSNSFQLLFQMVVSFKDVGRIRNEGYMNARELMISRFRFSILWTYLSLPSENRGFVLALGTLRPEDLGSGNDPVEAEEINKLLLLGFEP